MKQFDQTFSYETKEAQRATFYFENNYIKALKTRILTQKVYLNSKWTFFFLFKVPNQLFSVDTLFSREVSFVHENIKNKLSKVGYFRKISADCLVCPKGPCSARNRNLTESADLLFIYSVVSC